MLNANETRESTADLMKPSEKRKTTQPGLGKVTGETRRATLREGMPVDPSAELRAPASVSPPSTGRPAARHTRAIESRPPHERESDPPALAAAESQPPESSPVVASDARSRPPSSDRGPVSQPLDRGEPGAPARAQTDRFPVDVTHAVERFEARELPTGRRPISGRAPERPKSGRPAEPPPKTPPPPSSSVESRPGSGTARSRRVSIREDNVGEALQRTPNVPLGTSGPSSRSVPRLLKTKAEIAAAPIDHRAGFLLAHIDGTTSVQGLVDIAGMAETEVHEILERLRRLGIVGIR